MVKINRNKLKYMEIIRQLIITIVTMIILIWALIKNMGLSKLIISSFLICTMAKLGEIICLLIKKDYYIRLLQIIFLVSFLSFIFGFLIYAFFYSLKNQDYWLLLLTIFFFFMVLRMVKRYIKKQV